MEHILEHYLYGYSSNLRGFIFGFSHAAIMILGYYTGWSINRLLKIISNGYIAGIFGAALSHVVADVIASFLDPHIRKMVLGIVIGGIVPLFFIPLFEKYLVKISIIYSWSQYIVGYLIIKNCSLFNCKFFSKVFFL